MSKWEDIIKEDNIAKIKLPFCRGAKERKLESANAKVVSTFQEAIGKATTVADLVKAMEQFANQPSAEDIWAEGGASNPLKDSIFLAKEVEKSDRNIIKPQNRTQSTLLEIKAARLDDDLDGGAKEEALFRENIENLSRYFSRAFGIRDKFMEIMPSEEVRDLFNRTVNERKSQIEFNQYKEQNKSPTGQPTDSTQHFSTSLMSPKPTQQPTEQPTEQQGEFGKMQGWQTVLKEKDNR